MGLFPANDLQSVNKRIKHLETAPAQIDYVEHLKNLSVYPMDMSVYVTYDNFREFFINLKISDTQGFSYCFRKGTDDYILLMEGFYGDVTNVEAKMSQINATMSGTYTTAYPPNYWTGTINDSISCSFTGTRIDFNTYVNNQGGAWEFTLDEGLATEQTVTVSVYNDEAIAVKTITLFNNLSYKNYTLKGKFIGADPDNVVDNPRGWLYYGGMRTQDTKATFDIYNNSFHITKTTDILYSHSNKEFAIQCKPQGYDDTYLTWVPYHDKESAIKVLDAQLIVNGVNITLSNDMYINDVNSVQLIQNVNGVMESESDMPMMNIKTVHSLQHDGIMHMSGKIKYLRDLMIHVGYGPMLPYFKSFVDKVKSSMSNVYTTLSDGSKVYMQEDNEAISFIMVNETADSDSNNLALAMRYDNIYQTNRINQDGLPNKGQVSWIENRNDTMGKLYVLQYSDANVYTNDEYSFDASIIIGRLNGINGYVI